MKKILYLFIVLLLMMVTLLFLKNKEIMLEVYGMNEYMGFVDNGINRLKISIYTNKEDTLLIYPSKNIYELNMGSMSVLLEDVTVEQKKYDDIYEINIESKMPVIIEEELYSEINYLIIKNNEYEIKVNIGSISILKPYCEKLMVNEIFGSYSYVNNNISLVGINLNTLSNHNEIYCLRLGYNSYSNLSQVIENTFLEKEISILNHIKDYEFIVSNNSHTSKILNSNNNFYPISHNSFKLIRRSYIIVNFDNKSYYIDDYDFCDISIDKLKGYFIKGEVSYAKA